MNILAHLTLGEVSGVLSVFLLGVAVGAVVATVLFRRRTVRRVDGR